MPVLKRRCGWVKSDMSRCQDRKKYAYQNQKKINIKIIIYM